MQINALLKEDLEKRKMEKYFDDKALGQMARFIMEKETLLLVTGFPILECQVGETDGPSGTIALGRCLESLGKKVMILSDSYNEKLIKAAKKISQCQAPLYLIKKETLNIQWLKTRGVDGIVFIERPGKSEDGHYYNMRGDCISHMVEGVDELIDSAKRLKIPMAAIGDGGNEIGMGNLRGNKDDDIRFSVERVDILLVASISNLGCYGLIKTICDKVQLPCLLNEMYEKQLLRSLVDHGAVDGVTCQRVYAVDGLEEGLYLEKIKKITTAL